jgi:hypothetical protein
LIGTYQGIGTPYGSGAIAGIDSAAIEQSFQVGGEVLKIGSPMHRFFHPNASPVEVVCP